MALIWVIHKWMLILWAKTQAMGIEFPESIVALLAERLPGSVRRLEGVLFRMERHRTESGCKLDVPAVEPLLRELTMTIWAVL